VRRLVLLFVVLLSPVSVLSALPVELSTNVLLIAEATASVAVELSSSSCQGVSNAPGESFMMSKRCDVIKKPSEHKIYLLLRTLSITGARQN
jgi:hypothetical protein